MKKNISSGVFIIFLSVFLICVELIKSSYIFRFKYISTGIIGILFGILVIYYELKNQNKKNI